MISNTKINIVAVLQVLTVVCLAFLAMAAFNFNAKPDVPVAEKTDIATVRATIQTALPKTPIKSVQPSFIDNLYEVVTEKGLLLTDETGRYMFVGGVYDPVTNKDVLLERKRQLGFVDTEKSDDTSAQTNTRARQEMKAGPFPIDANALKELEKYTVTYKEVPGAPTIIELFDPMCPHCRVNHYATKDLPVTIKFALLRTAGSEEINQQVFCSSDPKAAVDSLIASNSIQSSTTDMSSCDVTPLQKIKEWLAKNGVAGATPQTMILDSHQLWRGEASTQTWKNRLGLN